MTMKVTLMAYEPRVKAPAMTVDDFEMVTTEVHERLRAAGAADRNYWNVQPEADKPFYRQFKKEVKEYYRGEQGTRCCYCSIELQGSHRAFDAEHILDKSTHPQLMFELNNLAASCILCNQAKNTKSPLSDGIVVAATVPSLSADYTIVHPQLDEWDSHLQFDDLNRIRPLGPSDKGKNTIGMCGITVLNAARLANYFSTGRRSAEKLLREFFRYKRRSKKQRCLDLLRELADKHLAKAAAIVDRLQQEMDETPSR
jgi:uncharacterized protein (TIGR02646 family)